MRTYFLRLCKYWILKDTESWIKIRLKKVLTQLKGFKFAATLVILFKKIETEDKTRYDNFYSSSKVEIIINKSNTDDVFQSIYTTVITIIQKYLGSGSVRIVHSVIDHTVSISSYNTLAVIKKQIYKSCKQLYTIR